MRESPASQLPFAAARTADLSQVELSNDELQLFDDISALVEVLWGKTVAARFRNDDPKSFSSVLFKRLRSNHRGFAVLWKHRLALESDIILRSGIEASICLAANHTMQERFVRLLKQDAVATIQGQIKVQSGPLGGGFVIDAEAMLLNLQAELQAGEKGAKLNWQTLATEADVPQLYSWHRMLSGLSSHITGVSLLTGFDLPGSTELADLQRKMHFNMMAGATLMGTMRHAAMLDALPEAEAALLLFDRMSEVSMLWYGEDDE